MQRNAVAFSEPIPGTKQKEATMKTTTSTRPWLKGAMARALTILALGADLHR